MYLQQWGEHWFNFFFVMVGTVEHHCKTFCFDGMLIRDNFNIYPEFYKTGGSRGKKELLNDCMS